MEEDKHFIKTFWFVVGVSAFGLIYITCLTFLQIPKDNVRFADTSIGWIEGTIVTTALNYLLGGNPLKKPDQPTIQQTGDNPIATTNPQNDEKTLP